MSRRRQLERACRLGLVAVLVLISAVPVQAGDETDYSAPYLVVEDGKLVTKYPAREHDAVAGAGTAENAVSASPTETGNERATIGGGVWLALVAVLSICTGLLAMAWRKRRGT